MNAILGIASNNAKGENSYMEPLKSGRKRSILENRPEVQPEEIEEYEQLLSMRFAEDPNQPPAAAREAFATRDIGIQDVRTKREERIKELHRKLYGPVVAKSSH